MTNQDQGSIPVGSNPPSHREGEGMSMPWKEGANPPGADEGRAARDPPLASTPAQASWHQAHPPVQAHITPLQTPLPPYAHTEVLLKRRTVRTLYLTTPSSTTGHGAQELRPGEGGNLLQRAGRPRAVTHPRRARAQQKLINPFTLMQTTNPTKTSMVDPSVTEFWSSTHRCQL